MFHTLNERLPDDAIVTADAGTTADWYGHHIRLGRNMMGNLSGRLATMLAAMPYAIAAKFAFPERPVVCTIGDGAFQMLGMNGLITVKRHWQEWANPTFIVLVLHNDDLNQVSWEMREAGDPRYDTSQLLEDMDYAGYAELLGLARYPGRATLTTSRPRGTAAFAADRPVVLDVITDKNVPPLPAHVTFEQAKGVASALLQRRPRRRCGASANSAPCGAMPRRGRRNRPMASVSSLLAANRRPHDPPHLAPSSCSTVGPTWPCRSRGYNVPTKPESRRHAGMGLDHHRRRRAPTAGDNRDRLRPMPRRQPRTSCGTRSPAS